MFVPPEDSKNKTASTTTPGVYFGVPNSLSADTPKIAVSPVRVVRTMKEDLADEKRRQERLLHLEPEKVSFFTTMWSNISGKTKAEAEMVALAKEREELRAKEEAERARLKAKAEAEAAIIAAEKERVRAIAEAEAKKVREKAEAEAAVIAAEIGRVRAKEEAETKAAEEAARIKREAEEAAVKAEKEREEAQARIIMEKEKGRAYAEVASSPEGAAVRDRALATAETMAGKILATHGKALAETVLEAAEIVEEKEKVRTTISKIVEEEEKALAEITKLVEAEEKERAEDIKIEASQKRALAEEAADLAEATLIKENNEADVAEILANKERNEAIEAKILAEEERARAVEAAKIEAKEIFAADRKVEIAVDTATKEVALLQKKARDEAAAIALAQETARKAEAVEVARIAAIEKQTHSS